MRTPELYGADCGCRAQNRKVGYGLDRGVEMGPVISAESKTRIEGLIAKGEQEGAASWWMAAAARCPGYEDGFFVFPTVLDEVPPAGRESRAPRSSDRCSA